MNTAAPDNDAFLPYQGHAVSDVHKIRAFLRTIGWMSVRHPQGRSYIEIVTNPESANPKKEIWCKT